MCTAEIRNKQQDKQKKKNWFNSSIILAVAIFLGLLSGYFPTSMTEGAASIISQLFINFLKLVSLPIIFLSIVSTASGMESVDEIKIIGKKVLKYTLLTTLIA